MSFEIALSSHKVTANFRRHDKASHAHLPHSVAIYNTLRRGLRTISRKFTNLMIFDVARRTAKVSDVVLDVGNSCINIYDSISNLQHDELMEEIIEVQTSTSVKVLAGGVMASGSAVKAVCSLKCSSRPLLAPNWGFSMHFDSW